MTTVEGGPENMIVCPAPAQVAGDAGADFFHGRRWILAQQSLHGHHLPGCAIAALKGVFFQKSGLHRARFFAAHQSFQRGDAAALGFHGQGQAGIAGDIVDEHRAGPAFAPAATFFGGGQADHLAQHIEQGSAGLDQHPIIDTVDMQTDLDRIGRFQDFFRRHRFSAGGQGRPCERSAAGAGTDKLYKSSPGHAAFSGTVLVVMFRTHKIPPVVMIILVSLFGIVTVRLHGFSLFNKVSLLGFRCPPKALTASLLGAKCGQMPVT
jgi:hypothetical protein